MLFISVETQRTRLFSVAEQMISHYRVTRRLSRRDG
jgi:hypothetical protein